MRSLLMTPPRTPDALHAWVRLFCNLDVPRAAVCPGHAAPFDYLAQSYFEPARDLVVVAPRGGAKTRLAALATLLDLLHKPPLQVRILGGSLEQSLRMWEHLLPDLERLAGVDGKLARRRVALAGGASVAVLTQSERAVRGLRVQKLRCDEVEQFRPEVWEAAQLVTRSLKATRGDGTISGAVEALSTHHRAGGLMAKLLDDAARDGTPVVRWCVLEVLQRCEPERECATCPLWDDCGGVAKTKCGGFVPIDDAIALKRRVSAETWETEMLCRRPSVRGAVFPSFDARVHVAASDPPANARWWLGVDFGFAAPLVCLWLCRGADGVTRVVDEHVQPQRTLAEHVAELRARAWPAPSFVACDPAGAARSEQTGASATAVLRAAGFHVRHRASRIADGLELIRALLRPAHGEPKLLVHPRCRQLVAALQAYRCATLGDGGFSELPVKDGTHDHLCDALRYALVNAETEPRVAVGAY